MRAATTKLEKGLASNQPFAILLIDGDNLRLFNSISYAAGDEAIQNMGRVLSEHLRPGDFLARWRSGDEFIAILPNTSGEGARSVGERFCSGIREASKHWAFPTSISIGIALHPQHGNHVNALIDAAEMANRIQRAVDNRAFEVSPGRSVSVGISIGCASWSEDGNTLEELLHAADAAMYGDKRNRAGQSRGALRR